MTGNKVTNSSSNTNIYVISTEGKGSAIKLTGDKTTVKGMDSDIRLGLEVKDDAILQMTGGTITVSDTGVHFLNTNSTENKLENITISSGKDDTPLLAGIRTENSTVTLENAKVTQATSAVVANNNSTITISGGSFETKGITIGAHNGSTITLDTNVQITSENTGLYASGLNSTVTITGGEITGKDSALSTANGGHIKGTDVALKAKGEGYGAFSNGVGSVIELHGNTKISDSTIGLFAQNHGAISMTGGTIITEGAALSVFKGGHITATDVTLTTNGKGFAISALDSESLIELQRTTINKALVGLNAQNSATIEMTGGAITATETALFATNGGHIKATGVTLTTKKNEEKTSGAIATGAGSIIELQENTTIENAVIGLGAINNGLIKMTGGKVVAHDTCIICKQWPYYSHRCHGNNKWQRIRCKFQRL